jgi:hypothetical protein
MYALTPDRKLTSLWVDSEGRLLVASDDTSNPLPVGAQLATQLLVNDDGEVIVSPD